MRRSTHLFAFTAVVFAATALMSVAYFLRAETPGVQSTHNPIASEPAATSSISGAPDSEPEKSSESQPTVRIGGKEFFVDIADTPEKRAQGLSGKESLEKEAGMLFVFEQNGMYGFWMKDMRFSIDILWLDSESRVVHIVKNASPESYPTSFMPESEARFVLELAAGTAESLNIATGSSVTFHW